MRRQAQAAHRFALSVGDDVEVNLVEPLPDADERTLGDPEPLRRRSVAARAE
jgi:hypothetical protein